MKPTMYTPALERPDTRLVANEQLRLGYANSEGEGPLFRDPAFMENREVPVHRWVPWIAGFAASFVEDCFQAFLPLRSGRSRVLDPFAGVGTTIVAALKAGHDAVGFEINPYAALACRAKIEAIELDVRELDETISRYDHASRNGSRTARGEKSRSPNRSSSKATALSGMWLSTDSAITIRERDATKANDRVGMCFIRDEPGPTDCNPPH